MRDERMNTDRRMLQRLLVLTVCVMLLSLVPAMGESAAAVPAVRKVIIDTDTGADDASALILAAKSPEIEILGVTVLVGNVDLEQGTRNALAALEIAGCEAPVCTRARANATAARKSTRSVCLARTAWEIGI